MFGEESIVSTALSSFNNAALFYPYFFAIAVLGIPLFYFAYIYGKDILLHLKWKTNTEKHIGLWSVLFLVLWLLIFGGNYAVIRDGISLLPLLIASVLFVSIVFVVKRAKELNYLEFFRNKKSNLIILLILLLGVFSAKQNLYGILLQLSAILCGIIVGSRIHTNTSTLSVSSIIFGTMTTLILMQPEFFRFGQLGNLTIVHLGVVLLTGFFAVTALVARYTNARSKIYQSAYVKLKWLFRIIATLALVLFVFTESVPVFLGLIAVLGISEMLTIYHSKQNYENISKQSWAFVLVCFGAIIMCPAISCLGFIYLASLSTTLKYKDFLRLL